jgi:hypothetical protein
MALQIGDSRFAVPVATGIVPMWYTMPFTIPAGELRCNYATVGFTAGNQNGRMRLFLAALRNDIHTEVPIQLFDYALVATQRTSRLALDNEFSIFGGDYVLIWEWSYALAPVDPHVGPPAAFADAIARRFCSVNAGAFDETGGVNFDDNIVEPPPWNNAAVFTDPDFPYGLPWVELYRCEILGGETVPGGEGGGGALPAIRNYVYPVEPTPVP